MTGDEDLNVVLWGEKALVPVHPGDRVEIYHAAAKPGRFGGIELGVGRGSVFRVPHEETRAITFTGTIIPGNGCMFIDNGTERYLIEGEFPAGSEMKITGVLRRKPYHPGYGRTGGVVPEKKWQSRLAALVARLDALAPP